MNIKEFAALKVGDKIALHLHDSEGEVVEVSAMGVRVVWGRRHAGETSFFYSVNSLAWTQWSKPEPSE